MGLGGSALDRATSGGDAAIERYGLLTTPADEELQTLSVLAARVFNAPQGAISVLTSAEQHQIATTGLEPSVRPRAASLCAAVADVREPVIVPDARLDPRFADLEAVSQEPGVRFYASAPLLTPDGETLGRLCVFDVEPRTSTDDQREALGFMATRVTDVLELRLRREQLESSMLELALARDELARSNEALWQFAAQVSHDLRNPLMAVRANAELLAGEPMVATDPDLAGIVGRITDAARGMGRMIHAVLNQAREGGHPTTGSADLAGVVDRALLDLSPLVRATGATVHVGDLPTVPGDADLLYSVFVNLLGNSLKYTRPGVAPVVQLWAERREGCWRVCVSDNGIGVPPDQARSIFLPYVRADGADGLHHDGYGIGLATVHRIVSAHRGQVGMDPCPDGGTCFWLELPAGPVPEEDLRDR